LEETEIKKPVSVVYRPLGGNIARNRSISTWFYWPVIRG